jgi:hypothetical protein
MGGWVGGGAGWGRARARVEWVGGTERRRDPLNTTHAAAQCCSRGAAWPVRDKGVCSSQGGDLRAALELLDEHLVFARQDEGRGEEVVACRLFCAPLPFDLLLHSFEVLDLHSGP